MPSRPRSRAHARVPDRALTAHKMVHTRQAWGRNSGANTFDSHAAVLFSTPRGRRGRVELPHPWLSAVSYQPSRKTGGFRFSARFPPFENREGWGTRQNIDVVRSLLCQNVRSILDCNYLYMADPNNASGGPPDQRLEVGHVLFMDLVGYSALKIEEQKQVIEELQEVVRGTEEFRRASEEGRVLRLPTGDGMALVFFVDPEAPLRCAVEISRVLRQLPGLRLRMGIHAGPVYGVGDINANKNVAGGGVNIAQRVMDCGDAGHILVSEETARFFAQVGKWGNCLHDIGSTRVKHGHRLHLFSLYVSEVGNPHLPHKLRRERVRRTTVIGGVLLAVSAIVVVVLIIIFPKHEHAPQHAINHQLTRNAAKLPLNAAAISPNGAYLAYIDATGLFVLEVRSGKGSRLAPPRDEVFVFASPDWSLAWSPDSTRLYVSGPARQDQVESLWLFSLVGSEPKRLSENAMDPSVAADGSIAYIDATTTQQVWAAGPEGEGAQVLLAARGRNSFTAIAWAPSGDRLAYIEETTDGDILGTVSSQSKKTTEVLTDIKLAAGPQAYYSDICWARDGRIIFIAASHPSQGSNLWAVSVDVSSGEKLGKPLQITDDVATFQSDLSITADGERLSFVRAKQNLRILLGYLEPTGQGLMKTDKFIADESNNWANHWTPDSKYLLFTSDRRQDIRNVFRRGLIDQESQPLNPTEEIQEGAVAVWGGSTILYWSRPASEGERPRSTILNVADGGNPPRRVREGPDDEIACALKTAVCILKSGPAGEGQKRSTVFSLLDLKTFEKRPLPAPKVDLGMISDWDISPDGETIAVVFSNKSKGVVALLRVADGSVKELSVPHFSGFDFVAWSADRNALYLASNVAKSSTLLRAGLAGTTSVLWQTKSEGLDRSLAPSPDGKYLAFTVTSTGESNAWLMEKF